jgi:hypothetical protein
MGNFQEKTAGVKRCFVTEGLDSEFVNRKCHCGQNLRVLFEQIYL